jgi:hypothetical protein
VTQALALLVPLVVAFDAVARRRGLARLAVAGLVVAGLGVAAVLPPGAVPIGWVGSLREGTTATNLSATLDRSVVLPWLAALGGRPAIDDLRAAVAENAWMLLLVAFGRLRVPAVAWLAAPTLGLVTSESPGARVAVAASAVAVAWAWAGARHPFARLAAVAVAAAAAAWVVDRPELAALSLPAGVAVVARAVGASVDRRGASGVMPAVLRGVALTLGAAVGAWAVATWADPGFLGEIPAHPWAGALDSWGWFRLVADSQGPVAWLAVLGLLGVARVRAGVGVALGMLVLGRVLFVASHGGETPWEPLRYHLVAWGPALALVGVGWRALPGWGRLVVGVAQVVAVLMASAGSPRALAPVSTSLQVEGRFALAASDAHPGCAFVGPVVDVRTPLPQNGHRPDLYTWTTVTFGRGRPVAIGEPPDAGCRLAFVGLDCSLENVDCGPVPPGAQTWTGAAVPFNLHHGCWRSPVVLAVSPLHP